MAALRSHDGAFLLGEMAAGTANAGKIYFAAGTPDPSDIVDGRVDLASSVMRELTEETGLDAAEVSIAEGWTAAIGLTRVAFMRDVRIDLPATEARALMIERMRALPDQELADMHIVRSKADIDPTRMPPFQVAFLQAALATI
jgi:8-oxo-dGTP pyrophosphatase MutT (NUDIX family)